MPDGSDVVMATWIYSALGGTTVVHLSSRLLKGVVLRYGALFFSELQCSLSRISGVQPSGALTVLQIAVTPPGRSNL